MPCQCTSLSFKTLASGSKGNSAIVLTEKTKLIIDIGIPYNTLKRHLEEENLSFNDFSGILITHSHNDHIKGLQITLKHTDLKVLIPKEMYSELKEIVPKDRVVFINKVNKLNDMLIELIPTSHDTISSCGYLITYNDKSLVYITDTGYLSRKNLKKITDKEIYLLESNHDEEMLMNGPYPPFLKQRVISDKGHLSNNTTASYLEEITTDKTKYVILAHISEKNNTHELAYQTTYKKLKDKNIEIMIALQDEVGKKVEV